MFAILITTSAILFAEMIALSIGGKLRQRTAGLYDHLATRHPDAYMDNSFSPTQSNLIASQNRYADVWFTAFLLILATAVVAYPLVPAAAIFARNINRFLQLSFWVSIFLGICALVLIVIGFLDFRTGKQFTQLRLALLIGLMAIIFGNLTSLVYNPPQAPVGYDEAFYQLVAFPLGDSNWTQLASNLLGKYRLQTEFQFIQVLGLPFMLVSLLDVLYILACSVYAHLTRRNVPVSVNLLILAPTLAGAASLCFGLF